MITLLRDAVSASAPGHPEHSSQLSSLAAALYARYEGAADLPALEEAISLNRDARALISADHPDDSRLLSNLSIMLRSRYGVHGRLADLDEAIGAANEAVRKVHGDHPNRCTFLINLRDALRVRHDRVAEPENLAAAMAAARDASRVTTAPPANRLFASRAWINDAARVGDWAEAGTGFDLALKLLPQVTPRHLSRADQERLLAETNGLATDAAACALYVGDSTGAVGRLEQGRAMLLTQALETQAELSELRAAAPELAGRFEQLQIALGAPSAGAWPGSAQAAGVLASKDTTIGWAG
jgi:hypothetical protein